MTQQRFVRIYNDILNLDAIALVETAGENVMKVHLVSGHTVTYRDKQAQILSSYLSCAIVCRDITPPKEVTAA